MYKTRILAAPTYGGDRTGLFYAFSTTYWRPKALAGIYPSVELMKSWYDNSPRTTPVGSYAYLGKEEFWSTEYKRPRVNYCQHSKANEVIYLPHSRFANSNIWSSGNEMCAYEPYWLEVLPTRKYLPDATPAPLDVQSAARRAWWTMQPSFRSQSNLLLSLVELKDFRDVANNLGDLIKQIDAPGIIRNKNLVTEPGRAARKNGAISSAEQTVAGGILFNNLALQPLLSDIATLIVTAQTTVMDAATAFMENGLQPFTTHYTEVLRQDFTVPTKYGIIVGKESSNIFTASMERTYSVQPRTAFENFQRYYGLELTYETLWNLLPYSFLADYVLSIGKSIRMMEVDKSVDLNLMTYYESQLQGSYWGKFWHVPQGNIYFGKDRLWGTPPRFLCGLRNTYYNRYRASPNYGPALPNIAKYRDKKLLNTMAILRCMF